MAKVEAGLLVLEVAAQGCPWLAAVGVEVVVSKENPGGSGCVCPGCRSIWFLEGFGFGYRCWGGVAESEQTRAERSSLWLKLGGRQRLPQTKLLNYLQKTERQEILTTVSGEKLRTRAALCSFHRKTPKDPHRLFIFVIFRPELEANQLEN